MHLHQQQKSRTERWFFLTYILFMIQRTNYSLFLTLQITFCEGSYRLYGRSPNSWSWRLEGNRCYGSPWYAGIRSRKVNRHVLPNFLDCNDLEYFKLYFHVECMLYSIVLKNVIASHDVAEEALIYSYGTSFNGFAATLMSKSAKFPNSSWLYVVCCSIRGYKILWKLEY